MVSNRTIRTRDKKPVELQCLECGHLIILIPKPLKNRNGYYWYSIRNYCDSCVQKKRSDNQKKTNRKKLLRDGHTKGIGILKETLFTLIEKGMTKGELRKEAKTFQYYQIYVNKHARYIYNSSDKPTVCKVCGYSLHTEVCHIKGLKSFPDDTPIKVINALNNLERLCRNHHWEFDHNHIKL
jgi:hypothetical protein